MWWQPSTSQLVAVKRQINSSSRDSKDRRGKKNKGKKEKKKKEEFVGMLFDFKILILPVKY